MDPDGKTELGEKLRRLLRADDEAAQDEIHAEISRLSPDPDWSDHVFQSDEFYDGEGYLDFARVVERIAEYRPIRP